MVTEVELDDALENRTIKFGFCEEKDESCRWL